MFQQVGDWADRVRRLLIRTNLHNHGRDLAALGKVNHRGASECIRVAVIEKHEIGEVHTNVGDTRGVNLHTR